jgi:hypothetical protein
VQLPGQLVQEIVRFAPTGDRSKPRRFSDSDESVVLEKDLDSLGMAKSSRFHANSAVDDASAPFYDSLASLS